MGRTTDLHWWDYGSYDLVWMLYNMKYVRGLSLKCSGYDKQDTWVEIAYWDR
jgi:hypothetical protein